MPRNLGLEDCQPYRLFRGSGNQCTKAFSRVNAAVNAAQKWPMMQSKSCLPPPDALTIGLMRNLLALLLLGTAWLGHAQLEVVPTFRILPGDVVQESVRLVRFDTNHFVVGWTYTEAGAQRLLAFGEAHTGQQICTVAGSFESPPGECVYAVPGSTNYARWKAGWLTHRTEKYFGISEAEAKAIVAGLKGEYQPSANLPAWLSFTNSPVNPGWRATETVTGILTNPNFNAVIHALQQRQGFEKLDEPEVTTVSGRAENSLRMNNIVWNVNSPVTNRLQTYVK